MVGREKCLKGISSKLRGGGGRDDALRRGGWVCRGEQGRKTGKEGLKGEGWGGSVN